MKQFLLAALLTTLILPCSSVAGTLMVWRLDWLQQVKEQADSGDAGTRAALDEVIGQADQALLRGPFSVVDKTGFPDDGDIHDYYSLAPYWWPDPESSDGLPYIRRDGQTNPQRYADGVDGKRRHDMAEDVTALTLAGYFTGEGRYLEHAARQVRTWFIDPRTVMNPNMEHSQYIPGRSAGRSFGIIDSRTFVDIVSAARVLHEAGALDDEDMAALKDWFGRFADWLADSEHGKLESAAANNHGSFYDLQLAAFSWFAGNDEMPAAIARRLIERRLPQQVEKDGRMPLELARTRPFHYTLFNLQAIINMAVLADRLGLDLLAIDRAGLIHAALAYISGQEETGHDWPLDRTHPDYEPLYDLLRLYDELAGAERFDTLIQQSGSAFESSRIHLLLPAETKR